MIVDKDYLREDLQKKINFKTNCLKFFNEKCAPYERRILLDNLYICFSNRKCEFASISGTSIFKFNNAHIYFGKKEGNVFFAEDENASKYFKLIVKSNNEFILNPVFNKSKMLGKHLEKFVFSAQGIEDVMENYYTKRPSKTTNKIFHNFTHSVYDISHIENHINTTIKTKESANKENLYL